MYRQYLITLFYLAIVCLSQAQEIPPVHCGQQEITNRLLRDQPELKRYQENAEQQLRQYQLARKTNPINPQRTTAIVTLPVVVHIIHNNGAENISNAQVLAGIQHLNEAYANTGFYDPADGVNTQIQFCLAQRDPNNNLTNGITRDVSPLTVMGGANYYSDDIAVKNLNRWNPNCYINIWLVRSIPGNVAGYAYLPSAHGSAVDGILMESTYFGSTPANSVVTIHEMGHYLGLYHTFEGACKNDDCSVDGDKVCDTPPDQSTASTSCGTTMNSCSTDILSGFSNDQNDLKEDYMDYGNLNCMKVFTQGQADRMNWFIQNVRKSLLSCLSCLSPCPAPVSASFTTSATNITTGTTVTFTNSSVNGNTYKWYLNNVQQAGTQHYSYTFNTPGTYTIKMSAHSSSPLCDSAAAIVTITVTCPLTVGFTPPDTTVAINSTVNFINTSAGATSYQWLLDDVPQSTTLNYSHTFPATGYYRVKLKATNGFCTDSVTRLVVVTNACVSETFQRTYGGQRSDIISDIRSTPDGGYIVAGRTGSFGAGDEDGFLLKIDQLGAVQWSKTFGAARTDGFYRVILTSDGGFMAVGQTKSYGYLTGAAWAVKTDAAGNLQWNRQFGENTTFGEIASNVIQASNGSYYITGRQNNNPGTGNVLVIKLDATGTLLWSKIFDDSDSDNGTSIMEDNGGILVSGTSRSTTWHDAFLMKLDVNGNVQWSKKYDVGGRNNAAGAAFTRQGNFYLMPLVTINDFTNTNTGRAMMLRIDLNGDAVEVKEIIAPDYIYGSTGTFIPTPDGGYLFQQSEDNGNADLNIIKLSPAGTVEWTRKYIQPGNQYTYTLRMTPDGGYISAGYTTTGGNDMYIARTDAMGNIPACNTTTVQVQVSTPTFTTTPFVWDDERNSNFTAVPHPVLQASPATIPSTLLCSGGPCTPPPDPCVTKAFQKTYTGVGNYHVFYINTTPDGGSIIGGTANPVAGDANQASASIDALAMKLKPDGEIEWARRVGGSQYDEFRKIRPVSDGGYIAIGASKSFNGRQNVYLVKLTATGTVSWSKNFNTNSATNDYGLDVIETSDGGFVLTGTINYSPPFAHGLLAKTDATGNIIWANEFHTADGVDISSVLENVDTLVVAADYWVASENRYYGTVTKINKNTGAVNSAMRFLSDGRGNFANRIYKTPEGFLISAHIIDGNSYLNKQVGILRLDQNLQVISNKKISASEPGFWSYATPAQNGEVIISTGNQGIASFFQLMQADGAGNIGWQKYYGSGQGFSTQIPANAQQYTDGTFITAASFTAQQSSGSDFKIHVVRTAPNGTTPGCTTTDINNQLTNTLISAQPHTWPTITPFVYQQPVAVTSNEADVPLQATVLCVSGNCQFNGIDGDDSICNRTDTFTYKVLRNAGCVLPTTWNIDQAYAQIVSTTDSTIRIFFKQSGTVKLYASLTTACTSTADSIGISIFDPYKPVNLGPDIQLCNVSTWPLNAGAGYKTYLWQDNSADSVFTAYNTGTYHVEATDHCNNVFRDTVIISQAPAPPFDLGPDLERCSNDTLQLTAPAGFTNYRWSSNYMISSIYGQTVRIFTDQDTLYSVTAEKGPGCIVIDTIRVKVKPTAPLNLGNDTSFCQNETITLDAGPGFSNYTWNTGANTQQITIGTAGNFFVNATNANGCISNDTLRVTNVFALPVVKLGNDTILCVNSSVTFRAGAGFTAYEWQDGSTGAALTATQPGMYWVKVTDQHTCVNADTVAITDIKALPSGFLPDTAQLCDWQRLELKPFTTFKQYQWYNNTTAPSITITGPGIYWLKVTDNFGCAGADTVKVVPKDCLKGLYLPNAFSPNNDRNNDLFRPTVYGYPEKYRLTIYNRWGQRVFETTDIYKGWDGTINGKPQDTGMFVWTCQYKLVGMDEKSEKGVLTLVR
ncbi:MAG: gliding motility-associated C-terminal domain-containing protein [Niastella sp.]|nr:gliding motility-associated C-terminal domain-containing protein [Niastella sp.]